MVFVYFYFFLIIFVEYYNIIYVCFIFLYLKYYRDDKGNVGLFVLVLGFFMGIILYFYNFKKYNFF